MKELVVKGVIAEKLSRLSDIGTLHYLGVDPVELISGPVVAIVGTRKPTPYGLRMTEQLSKELSQAGVTVVSGLAFGVDIAAHKAALAAHGKTIAILPSGLETIYPATHAKIAAEIVNCGGALLSEYEPSRVPRKVEFLERNRIIAALSDIVLIPEAAIKSGSLNTAKHAQSMGIPVCAVPGMVTNPQSGGTHWLLKQGAHIVTEVADVLQLLDMSGVPKQTTLFELPPSQALILNELSQGVQDVTLLSEKLQIDTSELLVQLTMLELDGRISQDAAGNWHIS